jgi:hypothetical protein
VRSRQTGTCEIAMGDRQSEGRRGQGGGHSKRSKHGREIRGGQQTMQRWAICYEQEFNDAMASWRQGRESARRLAGCGEERGKGSGVWISFTQ